MLEKLYWNCLLWHCEYPEIIELVLNFHGVPNFQMIFLKQFFSLAFCNPFALDLLLMNFHIAFTETFPEIHGCRN